MLDAPLLLHLRLGGASLRGCRGAFLHLLGPRENVGGYFSGCRDALFGLLCEGNQIWKDRPSLKQNPLLVCQIVHQSATTLSFRACHKIQSLDNATVMSSFPKPGVCTSPLLSYLSQNCTSIPFPYPSPIQCQDPMPGLLCQENLESDFHSLL